MKEERDQFAGTHRAAAWVSASPRQWILHDTNDLPGASQKPSMRKVLRLGADTGTKGYRRNVAGNKRFYDETGYGNLTASAIVDLPLQTGANQMNDHGWSNANLVRLHKAVLCANCDVISEGLNGHCAACGSEALLALSRVLGGTIQTGLSLLPDLPQIAIEVARRNYLSAAA